jgi:hypothetical protein
VQVAENQSSSELAQVSNSKKRHSECNQWNGLVGVNIVIFISPFRSLSKRVFIEI